MNSNFRYVKYVAVILIAVLSSSILAATPAIASENKSKKRIVVVSVPRLVWKDLEKADVPNINSLVAKGAVANLGVRVLGSPFTPAKNYATVSAGNRSSAADSLSASFVQPDEIYNGQKGKDIFVKQRGPIKVKNPAALGIGFELSLNSSANKLNGSKIGSFANALQKHDKSLAVYGNTDPCLEESPNCFDRSIAYVGSDSNGVMRNGDISRDLLRTAGNERPTLNYEKVVQKVGDSLKKNDVTVVECSDLERVDAARERTKKSVSEADFEKALKDCDQLIGSITSMISLDRDQIYVFAPTAPRSLEQTTVFVAAGKGISKGYASSATTRVRGIVTLVDIAPTILDSLNVPIPDEMGKTLIDWEANPVSNQSAKQNLAKMNTQAILREDVVVSQTWAIVVALVISALLSMVALTRPGIWSLLAKFMLVLTALLPIFTFIVQPAMFTLNDATRIVFAVVVMAAIAAVVFLGIGKKWGNIVMLLSIASFNLVVLIVDILFGGKLQFNSTFGNATIVGGRFAGWGNSAFAFVTISAIVFVAMVKELTKTKSVKVQNRINVWLLVFLVLVMVVDGMPYFGSDVGGVLALTPTIFVVAMMLFEKRISVKALAVATFATVGTISIFALLDLSRPVSQRTHLGRFAESLIHGDAGLIIERKMTASLRSFQRPALTIIVATSLILIAFLVFSKDKYMHKTIDKYPRVRLIIIPGTVAALLGTLLNDSGLSIPANMLVIALPCVTTLVLELSVNKKAKEVSESELVKS